MAKRNTNPPIAAGQRFGRLVAVEFVEYDKSYQQRWRFRCDCGGERICRISSARCGDAQSCGCLHREMAAVQGRAKRTHGLKRSTEYFSWQGMISRCCNPSNKRWADYGGRGVSVCERWRSFENFLADMGPKPGPGYSIERLDNNGNYRPDNCKWASNTEQSRNRRNNVWVVFRGERMLLTDAEKLTGLPRSSARRKIKDQE